MYNKITIKDKKVKGGRKCDEVIEMLKDKGASSLLMALSTEWRYDNRFDTTMNHLMEITHSSRSTVRKSLLKLQQLGFIKFSNRKLGPLYVGISVIVKSNLLTSPATYGSYTSEIPDDDTFSNGELPKIKNPQEDTKFDPTGDLKDIMSQYSNDVGEKDE